MGITTVLGNILPDELGFCQSHEHIYIRSCPAQAGGPIDDAEKSLAELAAFYQAGGRAIVDAQPVGCGRDAVVLERLAQQSGVHIIASTGFHKLSYYPAEHWVFATSEGELARLFTCELLEGMFLDADAAFPRRPSRIRAGQVKAALESEGLTPPYRNLFGAAANAAKTAHCPLMVHIEQGSSPLVLADFLESRSLAPDQLVFCHLDRAIPDLAVHKELCRRGMYLEYDTIARPKYHDDEKELNIIEEMLAAGYGERLLLSLDTTGARLESYGGTPGLAYIMSGFIPKMRKRGFSEAQIWRFFVENPACVFCKKTLDILPTSIL